MKRFAMIFALLSGSAVIAPDASASGRDRVHATRSELVTETEHLIGLELDRGHAELTVQRTVFNGGERHDQTTFWIGLPTTAVATGLRTLGEKDGKPHWYDGELLEAEEAAERYRELTGIGGYYPKDPALLSWRAQDTLALQVFPCPPGADKSVEYTLTMPTDYQDGRYRVQLPAMGTEARPAVVTLRPAHDRDQLFVDGDPVAASETIVLDRTVEIGLSPHQPEKIVTSLAVEGTGAGRHLVHWQIEAAPKLSQLPRNAKLVVLIDGSKSLRAEQTDAGVAAARAYLGQFDDARLGAKAQVIVFDREVRARQSEFVGVRRAIADLARRPITRRNGSALDEALEAATKRLARQRGPKRIVVLTDLRTRMELGAEEVERLSRKTGAIVHVALIDDGAPSLRRDDGHPWAEVARKTGGVLWRAAASPEAADAPRMGEVYEEWARPLRIDNLEVMIDGSDFAFPQHLDEGQQLSELTLSGVRPTALELRGELWSRPIRQDARRSGVASKLWSALVFGTDLLSELDEAEMMVLAMRGGAVSPVTSYLAIEPGVRPSTEGLDWGLGVVGTGFGGGGSGSGFGFGRGRLTKFDPDAFLQRHLAPAWAACGGQGRPVGVEFESTFDEVVDVHAAKLDRGQDREATGCLEDAVWALFLHARFDDEHRLWRVRLDG